MKTFVTRMKLGSFILLFLAAISPGYLTSVYGASLTYISDTVSSSNPGVLVNHRITFTISNGIPASGKIVITPQSGEFTIPGSLDYTDIDLIRNGVDQVLASIPGSGPGSAMGVAVESGSNGKMTITLNDSDGLAVGSQMEIKIGTNASFGATGDQRIQNPSTQGSYEMHIQTKDGSGGIIDEANTIIATINPINTRGAKSSGSGGGGGGGGGGGDGGGGGEAPPPQAPPPVPQVKKDSPNADFNGSGSVGLTDLSIMMFHFGRRVGVGSKPDLNGDGLVSLVDFSIMMSQWSS